MDPGLVASASVSFSINLFRPYILHPPDCQQEKGSRSSGQRDPSVSENPPIQDEVAKDSTGEMGIVKSSISIDEEIVRRRWFHEEMRQSPVSSP